MSIASQLTALEGNISDAYDMVAQRGGTVPARKNMENLDDAIASIPSGGGSFVGIPKEVDSQGVYGPPTQSFSFSFPSNATSVANRGLYSAFRDCLTITSVDASSLTSVSGGYSFYFAFYGCTSLTSADFGSLASTSGDYPFYYAFYNCTSLSSIDFSSLTSISGGYSFNYAFYNCSSLTSADFSSLVTISGGMAFQNIFYGCTSLTSVDFSSLATISGGSILAAAFRGCSSLRTLSFPSLLPDGIIGNVTNQFDGMLQGCTGVTVHFKSELQAKIGNWTSVQNGFSGTNTTVLFDL